jgi:hypothetical protein
MINRWYINNVGELYTVHKGDMKDAYEDEDEELAQPLPNFQSMLLHSVLLIGFHQSFTKEKNKIYLAS